MSHSDWHWIYVSPDGTERPLYPTLHEGETLVSGEFYSCDGSYLRLRAQPGNTWRSYPEATATYCRRPID